MLYYIHNESGVVYSKDEVSRLVSSGENYLNEFTPIFRTINYGTY